MKPNFEELFKLSIEEMKEALEALDYACQKLNNKSINGHRVLEQRRNALRNFIADCEE